MTDATQTILVVHSDPVTRATLARTLAAAGRTVLEAGDGPTALQLVQTRTVRLVVTDLYLRTGDSDCLIQAVRQNRVRGMRTLALTTHRAKADREWAKQWGASGFLHEPSPERMRYVVTRLLASPPMRTANGDITRRDSLDVALGEIEGGTLQGTRSIVVGRPWWAALERSERVTFRQRARRARVTLRSDAMMSRHFVELRGGSALPKAEPVKESPYRH